MKPLLDVRDLRVELNGRVRPVDGISLSIGAGETFAKVEGPRKSGIRKLQVDSRGGGVGNYRGGRLSWRTANEQLVRTVVHIGRKGVELLPCPGDAYQREDDYFVECVLSGQVPARCSPASSRTSVVLAWLDRRAVETHQTLRLSGRLHAAWAV